MSRNPTTSIRLAGSTTMKIVWTRSIRHLTAGDTVLEVESTVGFTVGDVIDIGGQELKQIIQISSLVIDIPLQFSYTKGTTIAKATAEVASKYDAQVGRQQPSLEQDDASSFTVFISVCSLGACMCFLAPLVCCFRLNRRRAMLKQFDAISIEGPSAGQTDSADARPQIVVPQIEDPEACGAETLCDSSLGYSTEQWAPSPTKPFHGSLEPFTMDSPRMPMTWSIASSSKLDIESAPGAPAERIFVDL